eukprot:1987478-Ditylum_brightwellii.AAC.1
MECILKANNSAPQYLSCGLTNDGLAKICSVTGSNSKKTALAFLDALLPGNVISNLNGYIKDDVERVNELIKLIQCSNFVNDDEDTQLWNDANTTTTITYAPLVNLITQLIDATVKHLVDDDKVEG